MSAATSARNVGVAAAPVVGPAQTKLAVWVANVPVRVPEPVTGEPETVRMLEGSARATEVTVPTGAAPPSWMVPRVSAKVAMWPLVKVPVTLATVPPAPEAALTAAVPRPRFVRLVEAEATSERLLAATRAPIPLAEIATFEVAVINPLALTVWAATCVESPKLPTFELTVARVATAPEVVMSPEILAAAVVRPLRHWC